LAGTFICFLEELVELSQDWPTALAGDAMLEVESGGVDGKLAAFSGETVSGWRQRRRVGGNLHMFSGRTRRVEPGLADGFGWRRNARGGIWWRGRETGCIQWRHFPCPALFRSSWREPSYVFWKNSSS